MPNEREMAGSHVDVAVSTDTGLQIATALEVALFGRSPRGNLEAKLYRIERCLGDAATSKTATERLSELLVATLCVPPLIEFSPDDRPEKLMYLAYFPFQVVGIFEDRAAALESLRPFVQAHDNGSRDLPSIETNPHAFRPALGLQMFAGASGLVNYVEAAHMARCYPKHRKPVPEGAALTPAAEYRAALPKSLPRLPGRDFKELVVAAVRQADGAMVMMQMTW